MKPFLQPPQLIWFGFVLGYLCLFLPGTVIDYQVLDGPTTLTQSGWASVFGSPAGWEALPCTFPRLTTAPEAQFTNLLLIWQLVGRGLSIGAVMVGPQYLAHRKMPLPLFFGLAVLLLVGPVLGFAAFAAVAPSQRPFCAATVQYQFLSFSPFWPTVGLLLTANLLGYVGLQRVRPPTPPKS